MSEKESQGRVSMDESAMGLLGLVSDEKLQEISNAMKQDVSKGQPKEGEPVAERQSGTQPTEPVAEQPKAEPKVVEPNVEIPKIEGLENTIFAKDFKEASAPVEIKDLNEAIELIKKDAGFEMKDAGDLSKFVSEYKSLKEKVGGIDELEKKATGYESILVNMPDEIHHAMDAWLKGEDYKEVLKGYAKELDFTVPADKQDKQRLIEKYYPGKFSAEDYQDEDNAKLEFAYEEAKKKFEADRKSYVPYKELSVRQQKELSERMQASAQTSFATLSSKYQVGEDRKKKIGQTMSGGAKAIVDLFVDEKGNFKPDAAERLMYAFYAEDDFNTLKKFIKNRTETKVAEDFVTRGNDSPSARGIDGGVKDAETVKKDAKKYVDGLFS